MHFHQWAYPSAYMHGDPAYPLRIHLQAPFRNTARLTRQMELFNKSMSKVRMWVEWIFGDVINDFKFLDFKKNLKIGLSAVGEMYINCRCHITELSDMVIW